MAIIANPIYDVVFKYLLEDLSIAKGLLSRIIGEEIESLEVKSQETIYEEVRLDHPGLRLLRLDFKAVICTNNPLYKPEDKNSKEPEFLRKKILIELQKAKELFDIMRFRKYLAENYAKADVYIDAKGKNKEEVLEIISIYFLGFQLQDTPYSVLKIGREITDVLGEKIVLLSKLDPFIALLTHESYMIQLHRLEEQYQSPLERILMLFNQKYVIEDDRQKLKIVQEFDGDELFDKAERRLERAIADDYFRKKMDIEDEIERTILRKLKDKEIELAEKEMIIEEERRKNAEKVLMLAEKDSALAEKDTALAEKDTALAEKDILLAQLAAEFEAFRKGKK